MAGRLGLALALLVGAQSLSLAVVTPPPTDSSLGTAERLATLGRSRTAATVSWMAAVWALSDGADPHRLAPPLHRAVRLDPDFDAPWVGGALMLRIAEAGDGPHIRQHLRRGRAVRPDLPWAALDPGPTP
jgi:hypothetical protein